MGRCDLGPLGLLRCAVCENHCRSVLMCCVLVGLGISPTRGLNLGKTFGVLETGFEEGEMSFYDLVTPMQLQRNSFAAVPSRNLVFQKSYREPNPQFSRSAQGAADTQKLLCTAPAESLSESTAQLCCVCEVGFVPLRG